MDGQNVVDQVMYKDYVPTQRTLSELGQRRNSLVSLVFASVSKDTECRIKPGLYQAVRLAVPVVTEVHAGIMHWGAMRRQSPCFETKVSVFWNWSKRIPFRRSLVGD